MRKKRVPISKVKAACDWAGVSEDYHSDDPFEPEPSWSSPRGDLSRWKMLGAWLQFRVDDRSGLNFIFDGVKRGAKVVSVTLSSVLEDGGMMTVNLSDLPSGELVARALMGDDVSREGAMTALRWRNTVLNALHEHKKARV